MLVVVNFLDLGRRVKAIESKGEYVSPTIPLRKGDIFVGTMSTEEKALYTACNQISEQIEALRSTASSAAAILLQMEHEVLLNRMCSSIYGRYGYSNNYALRDGYFIVESAPEEVEVVVEVVMITMDERSFGVAPMEFSNMNLLLLSLMAEMGGITQEQHAGYEMFAEDLGLCRHWPRRP